MPLEGIRHRYLAAFRRALRRVQDRSAAFPDLLDSNRSVSRLP